MAKKLPTPCRVRSCPKLGEFHGFCEQHKDQNWKPYEQNRRTSRQRGYTGTWDQVRRLKRRRDPLCEMCKKEGRYRPAAMVHHIIPLDKGGELLAMDNLQSLCNECHGKIHGEGK